VPGRVDLAKLPKLPTTMSDFNVNESNFDNRQHVVGSRLERIQSASPATRLHLGPLEGSQKTGGSFLKSVGRHGKI
jgi:hypothetical protein